MTERNQNADEDELAVDRDRLLRGIARASQLLVDIEDDYTAAMDRCLEAIGGALEVDRVYIFEAHQSGDGSTLCSQRFEWSRGSVAPQIDNPELQDVPMAGLGDWEQTLRAGRSLDFVVATYPHREVREILQAQDIVSILVVPITLAGEFWGFVGFDDCSRPRRWREAEILALTAISGAIGAAIVRSRLVRTMLELSTPILQLWQGVLVVPLVGRLTRDRAERLTEDVLLAIQARGATDVLLDITGVSGLGVGEVQGLFRTVRAAKLLGAQCTLIGASPAVARRLAEAEIDFTGVAVCAKLEDGLAKVLAHRGLTVS
jgi:anti-anti-sigma regulatory factor